MEKEQVIEIAEALGFHLNLDRWNDTACEWLRFQLKDDLDERELRLIWYKDWNIEANLRNAGQILFKAGQKAFRQKLSKYEEL